jgi:hypothetical protein
MRDRRVTLIGLLGIGLVAIWIADASAHSAGMRIRADGTLYHASSVRCQFEATGAGGDSTVGLCEISTDEAIVFCINPADQSVTGTPRRLNISSDNFQAVTVGVKTGGTHKYVVTADSDGVAQSDAECDASPECVALRQFCINRNWTPVDVVPIHFFVRISTYACTSTTASACPCHPEERDGLPLCLDHDPNMPGVNPEASLTYECQLPIPAEQYEFGDLVQYNCALVGG